MSLLTSQLVLEDVGALLLDNWFLTADPMGPRLDQDEEDDLPPSLSSFSSSRSLSLSNSSASSLSPSSLFSLSPSPSHLSSSDSLPPSPRPSFLGSSKAGSGVEDHLMPLTPWLDSSELLHAHMGTNVCGDDAFSGMDWMAEKIDLSDFDLDSLIGSCCSDAPPSSPEELLASLETHMDLDLVDPFTATIPAPHEVLSLGIPLADLPSLELPEEEVRDEVRGPVVTVQDQEVVVKSEPQSPAPLSMGYTLELGSEVDVDVLEVKTTHTPPTIISEPSDSLQTTAPIVLSLLPSGHFVVVLSPKEEPTILPTSTLSASSSCDDQSDDSDSGIDSVSGSPPHHPSSSPSPSIAGSSRTKPYSKPEPETTSPTTLSGKVKSVSGAPKVVEKKLKKMEQNKTAATRYRQKKKSEQEVLSAECSELEQRNSELAEKADGISREIQYLRDLMEEVRSAKNRKKTTVSVA
ncbi:cyclic AMP-dependent transcription factor ATF-4 [Salvelinus alpinus]|uniref:cyclic AMP-dependent transcription factor ATF-4 n=1 Tax=Salvelinus alpinus TaxID=8036 RepID=UPI0039FCDFAD